MSNRTRPKITEEPIPAKRKPIAPVIIICQYCKKEFKSYPCRTKTKKYCSKECHNLAIKGVPRPDRSVKYKGRFKLADNPNYKGDAVGYSGIHSWVHRNIPKPPVCSVCKEKSEKCKLEAHNISGKYTRDINDWEWVCTKCHQKRDGRNETLKYNAENFRADNGRLTVGGTKHLLIEKEQRNQYHLRSEK